MCEFYSKSDIAFTISQFRKLTTEKKYTLPSEYVEEKRYLPKGLTPKWGYYEYSYTPYLREIIDCFDMSSPVRKIAVLKSAQIGATVGLIESIILYHIGCVPMPQLFVTADKELAKKTMVDRIEPMLEYSGLDNLIYAQYGKGGHRTGSTVLSKEYPGGKLHAIGAKNPDAFRGVTYPRMYLDEIDTYSRDLKGEGNAVGIVDNRTNAFAQTRKILYTGTPLLEQTSQIWNMFLLGDQKYFQVPCPYCNGFQDLRWYSVNKDTGLLYGIKWQSDKNFLPIPETIGYCCKFCGKIIKHYHKTEMLAAGKWVATAKTKELGLTSYAINSLYSPVGMYSWLNLIYDWLKCWDIEKNRVKDKDEYKEFRNTKQGLPWKHSGKQIKYEKVIQNRNVNYLKNQINNIKVEMDSGGIIQIITCAVDVQKDNLFVDVKGWCRGCISYTLDFFSIDGDPQQIETWDKLYNVIDQKMWVDEFGKQYIIGITVIDSKKWTDEVYAFTTRFPNNVYAIGGMEKIKGRQLYQEFKTTKSTEAGVNIAYHINTTRIKDRLANMFNLMWEAGKTQPEWYPNFPQDMRDDYFKHFEAEHKVDILEKETNLWLRTRWIPIPGRENHAFDTFVYNIAALEILKDSICLNDLELIKPDWNKFWDDAEARPYYKLPKIT